MSTYLYMLIPYMSLGVVAMSLRFKLHRRSIATFMSFVAIAITSNCFYFGYFEAGVVVIIIYIATSMWRAICKPQTDKFFHSSHCSIRECPNRKCAS